MQFLLLTGYAGFGFLEGLTFPHEEFLYKGIADAGEAFHHAVLNCGITANYTILDGLVTLDLLLFTASATRFMLFFSIFDSFCAPATLLTAVAARNKITVLNELFI